MIREGGIQTITSSNTDVLANTQFTTITQRRQFTVRASAGGAPTAAVHLSYDFLVGTLSLSKGVLSSPQNGIGAAGQGGIGAMEDPVIYSGMIPPGNLFLRVTPVGTADVEPHTIMFDITGF